MTREEILAGYVYAYVPGLSGWAYRGAEYCASCGHALAAQIVEEWDHSGYIGNVTHSTLCNSEVFPQPISFHDIEWCEECGEV